MLKYEIQVTDNEIKREEMKWSEKYLAPNLSFVTGVTSQSYHLGKYNYIQASNPLTHTSDTLLPIESVDVTRQGYVKILNKAYPIEKGSTYNYNANSGLTYSYVYVNGKYFYPNNNTYTFTNWLQESGDTVVEGNYVVPTSSADTEIALDTIVWIEDGYVTIDGITYKYNNDLSGLTLYDDEVTIPCSGITKCSEMDFKYYTNPNDFKRVTKFLIRKNEEINENFDNVSYITRYYYITYKNHYLSVIIDNDSNFICEVPNYLLTNGTIEDGVTPNKVYQEINGQNEPISGDTFDVLYDLLSYVVIDDDRYNVGHEIMNANEGKEIAIYLTNPAHNIINGDTVRFSDPSSSRMYYDVQEDNGVKYIVFNGEKYFVKPNICDRVKMEDEEYFIDYINGKKASADCVVRIDGNDIPMKLISGDTKWQVQQYGYVVDSLSSVTQVKYDIVSYSGVTIDGVSYLVDSNDMVYIDTPNDYIFKVKEVIGSSMLLCEPRLSDNDFSEDEIREQSKKICNTVVLNQSELALYMKNKIFGDREITDKLAFNATSTPSSSDDYFNLFENLTLYTSNGYIHIPMALTSQKGGNPLLDNIVERDFFEYEKNKAINPIIDMEKDVYCPKTIETEDGKYHGSETIFGDIDEIRVNLHFRTRDEESWKVIEDGGWFVTDYQPYTRVGDKDGLMNKSDLMGLLHFTNNDVFYQKSKISKSFLRFSFYDSFNQQNQNLLATSTVFMDEHRMFKTYVDNSRKNINVYKRVNDTKNTLTKIAVDAEWYGSKKSPSSEPYFEDNHRIGSEFIIKSKYETDTSSEGYYIYMHKEYSEGLRPKQIFMKVEFNHAGVGRTIPFIVPMKWKTNNEDNRFKNPKEVLKITSSSDELKKGVKLEDSYAQMYIPLYAVYDFKNKEYAYVFDERYISSPNIEKDNGKKIIRLNLFEIKFSNGTEPQDDDKIAKINFNQDQFEEVTPTCPKNNEENI